MENAVLAGYRYFDCTAVYGNEARLGMALRNILSNTSKFQINREDVKIHRFSNFITCTRVAYPFFNFVVLQDEPRLCPASS